MYKSFVIIMVLAGTTKLRAEAKDQMQNKLNFTPGHYEVIVPQENPTSFCETEEIDIDLIDDKSELTLAFGYGVSFPRLETTQYNEVTAPGCKTHYTNNFQSNKLEQTRIEKCGKKTNTKKYLIEFSKSTIQITVEEQKNKKTCSYKFKNQKG